MNQLLVLTCVAILQFTGLVADTSCNSFQSIAAQNDFATYGDLNESNSDTLLASILTSFPVKIVTRSGPATQFLDPVKFPSVVL